MNKRQMAYLVSLGLPEGASETQVKAFVATLGKAQAGFLQGPFNVEDPAGGDAGGGEADGGSAEVNPRSAVRGLSDGAQPPAAGPAAAEPAPATPAAADVQTAVQNAVRAEQTRITHIQGVARQLGLGDAWAQKQVDGHFTVDQANAAAVTQAAANRPPVDMQSVEVGVDRQGAAVAQALVDAVVLRAGGPLLERDAATGLPVAGTTRQPHEMAGRFRGNSLMLAQQFLTMCGRQTVGLSAPELARAAFVDCPRVNHVGLGGTMTSADFPYLLANAVGITLQQRYATYPTQWRRFAVDMPASDFRTQTLVRHGELPILPEIKEGGEYTYVTFGEEREQWALAKRGLIVALSWEMVLNDQLGAFARTVAMEGDAAARTDDTLAFAVLTGNAAMGDAVALFDATTHANNVAAGSGAPPSMTTYAAMILAMKTQAAPKRNSTDTSVYIVAEPAVIVCPVALEATVDMLNLAERDPDIDVPMGLNKPNIYRGRFTRASHPLLDAVATYGAYTWHACTDPAVNPAMLMGYLDGMVGPQLQQESGFDTDVRKYKVTHARAAKATDWRLWYRNVGV